MELQENLLQLRLDQYDEKHYEQFTARSEADKAIHSLKGILTGISLDREINSSEVNELFAWTKIHYDLRLLCQKSPCTWAFRRGMNGSH
jgi:hypothetical protein